MIACASGTYLVSKPSRPPSAKVFRRSFCSCLAASECPALARDALKKGTQVGQPLQRWQDALATSND